MNTVNDPIVALIEEFLMNGAGWLACSLRKVLLVSKQRTTPYGFEWLIQTALACFLINKKQVGNLKIGQQDQDTKKKYDISFELNNEQFIIELKTTANLDLSFVKKDAQKTVPSDAKLYLLVFSYPTDKESPKIENCELLIDQLTYENFKCLLFRKKN
ncbi:hypothetical protein JCM12298_26700 [Desulfothermus naphthae]